MEIREGYKQTEVGVIPEDWNVQSVNELLEDNLLVDHMDGNHGQLYPRSNEFKLYGVPYIGATDFADGIVDFTKCKYVSIMRAMQFRKGVAINGDVLFAHNATVGPVALLETKLKFIILSTTATYYRCNFNKISNAYLKAYFESEYFVNQYKSVMSQSTRNQVPITAQRKFFIVLPSFEEQQAIATALTDIDQLIVSLTKLIDKKKNIKQGIMQELLRPKDDWVEKELGETAILKARIGWQGLTTAEYKETGECYLITGTEFKNGFIDWDNCYYVDEARYKQDRNIQVKINDVLVTKDGTIGKVAIINTLPKPSTLNSGIFVIRPLDQAFHPQFLYYLLMSTLFTKFLSQLSAGSTINHLYQKDFVNFYYQTPSKIEEQIRIADILSEMDTEISALEAKLTKYKAIKQGMMQELLTGRIRLVEEVMQ